MSYFFDAVVVTRLIPFIIPCESAHFVAAAYGHKLYMVFPARVAPLSPLSLCLFCLLFVAFLAQFGESFVSRLLLSVRVSPNRFAATRRASPRRVSEMKSLGRGVGLL